MKNYNYDREILCNDLIKYMDENGITIRAFGKMAGISPSIISRIKSRDYNPGMNMIDKIRDVIGYHIEEYKPNDIDGILWDELTMDQLNDLIDRATSERSKRIQIIKIKAEIEKLQAQLKELEG